MLTRALRGLIGQSKKSVLLLGPRQTGKSTLTQSLHPDLTINLAHEATYIDFLTTPLLLEQSLAVYQKPATIFIDEIQRLPSLLNTIQVLVDHPKPRLRFLLTGSSARKLKRGQANLLPGRIFTHHLGPLTTREMGYAMDTRQALSVGTLPGILTDDDAYSREKTLRTYAATYLKEEIQAEGLARNLEGFARFLKVAAEWAGHFLDLAKMASVSMVARQSAVRYFEVLEDCLVVWRADAFAKSLTRRLIQHPKYYFFDVGVLNGLLGNFTASADRVGSLFEHLVATQILHGAAHCDKPVRLSTYRTEHGAEVDLIAEIGGNVHAIEIKASANVGHADLRGLESFSEYYGKKHQSMIFYPGSHPRKLKNVDILPWQEGIKELGL